MATNETGTITLRILANDLASGKVGQFIGRLDTLAKKGGLMGSVMQGVGQSFGQMINPMTAATKLFDTGAQAVGVMHDMMINLARAYEEDRDAAARFNLTLRNSLGDFGAYREQMQAAILAGQRLAFSDDQQRESLAKLVTSTRSATRAIELNRLAMNIARQRSVSLEAATDAVAKAAQGQTRALRGLGYQIDTTASATEVLASVTAQATGASDLFAESAGGKLAIRILELNERAEAAGRTMVRVKDAQDDATVAIAEGSVWVAEMTGVMLDWLGVGDQAVEKTKELGTAFQSVDIVVGDVAKSMRARLNQLPDAFTSAVVDMKSRVKKGKAGIIEEFRDLAWQSKHPFAEKNYADWLRDRQQEAMRKSRNAAKKGRPGVEAQYNEMVNTIGLELLRLPTIAANVQAQIMASVGIIRMGIGNLFSNVLNPGQGLGGVGENASGTANWRGGWTWVGEQGRELVHLPQGSAIKSNPESERMASGNLTVNVTFNSAVTPSEAEGQRLAAAIVPHIQRHMARAGI